MRTLLIFILNQICLSFTKVIIYVNSSALMSGSGLSMNDPLNEIEGALTQSSDDLEIVIISSEQPYKIKSYFEFQKTFKITSSTSSRPTIVFYELGSLSFVSNMTIKGLIITGTQNGVVGKINGVIFRCGGSNTNLNRNLEELEIKDIDFEKGNFMAGNLGTFTLTNISFSKITAALSNLITISLCDSVIIQNMSFIEMKFYNYGIIEIGLGCAFQTNYLVISSSLFNSTTSFKPLISVSGNLLLGNFRVAKNLLINCVIIATSNSSAIITLDSVVISENSALLDSGPLILYCDKPGTKLLLKDTVITLNYAAGLLIDFTSLNSFVTISNVSLLKNAFCIGLSLDGPYSFVSISSLLIRENNDISSLSSLLYNGSMVTKFSDTFGQAVLIKDFSSVSIVRLSLVDNMAQNYLQGVGLQHSEKYLKEILSTQSLYPEVTILSLKCENNKGYHTKTPAQYGNCLNLDFLGKISIGSSSFTANELDIDLRSLITGATSPCIYSLNSNIELVVTNTVFDKNKGYDGCHCITFIGKKLSLINLSFTNLGSSKVEESKNNQAGALSLGASLVEIKNVTINSCLAQKAAGILFQNWGHSKEILLYSDGLVIRNNRAKQTAGLEFDGSLPPGIYIFNNSVVDNNKVEFYGVIALFFNNIIDITFIKSNFTSNQGSSAGALLTLLNLFGDFYFNDSSFSNNTLLGEKVFIGGSVVLAHGGLFYTFIHFYRCILIRNYCTNKAGAIAINYGRLKINDSIFESNSAPLGGSITVGYSSRMFLFNTTFIGGIQDVEINEAAGIFVNDESFSVVTNCHFINLKAAVAAAIKMQGISSQINVSSSTFIGNRANQGTIIYYFNRFINLPNMFMDCLIQGNTGEHELIMTKNVLFLGKNLTGFNNKGRIFVVIQSVSQIESFLIINHTCPIRVDQGCFAYISLGTNANFFRGGFHNVSSGFERDFFLIKESSVTINDLTYKDVSTRAEFGLAYVLDSEITLTAIRISNLSSNMIYGEISFINIANSSFFNVSHLNIYKYGTIQCLNCFRLAATLNNFSLITTKSLGGVFYLSKGVGGPEKFVISYNYFNKAYSQSGGVLYTEDQNLNFLYNNASENNATDKGGVLFLKTEYRSNITWTVKQNNFISNEAKGGGCVHSLGNIPNEIYSNFYENNKATYGNDYSSFAVRLTLEKKLSNNESNATILLLTLNCSDLNDNCSIKNVPSGLSFENILVSIIDTYGQKMVLEETIGFIDLAYKSDYPNPVGFGVGDVPDLLVGSSQRTILKGVKSAKGHKGVFNFSELIMVASPNSKVVLTVRSEIIKGFMPEYISSDSKSDLSTLKGNIYNFLFVLELRNCVRGEIYIAKDNICFPCPEGMYSLDTTDTECSPCPKNAHCEGRDQIIVNHGYWRKSVNSTNIWQCNAVSDPCLGGYDSVCKEGYTATICGSCVFDSHSNRYFKSGIFYCFPCEEISKYMGVLAVGVVLLIFVLVFLVWSKQSQSVSEGALIKLLINHVQFISFISNIKITLPDILQSFSSMQAPMTSADTFVFAMDCLKDKFSIPLFSVKILLSVVITIFVTFVNFLVFFIVMKIKKQSLEEMLVNLVNSLVIVAMFLQPQFINFYIQMLSCETYERSYMVNYLDQVCWEGEHLMYSLFITIPMLIFWMFIYPGSFLIYMYKNREKLNDKNVIRITVFFRAGFKHRLYFWEFVIMSRKFCIILITAFLRNDMESVFYILIPVIAIFCALQIYIRPYNQKKFNYLEIISLNASFITYYSAIFYLKIISNSLKLLFLIIVIGANMVFIMIWLREYIIKLRESMGIVSSFISHMSSSIRKSKKSSTSTQIIEIYSPISSRKMFK